MPITIIPSGWEYRSNGAGPISTTDLIGNTGDRVQGKWRIVSDVTLFNNANDPTTWFINPGNFITVNFPTNPLTEGFRVGDYLDMDCSGTNTWSINRTITAITSNSITFDLNINNYDPSSDFITFRLRYQNASGVSQTRENIRILPNFVPFTSNSGTNSIIDGEQTRFTFPQFLSGASGSIFPGTPIGNQSGTYMEQVDPLPTYNIRMEDVTSIVAGPSIFNNRQYYDLYIDMYIPGVYRPDLFELGDCINFNLTVEANRTMTEVSNVYVNNDVQQCNIGRFNEPYNIGSQTFLLVQGIDELDYSQAATYPITIQSDSLLTSQVISFGGIYRSKSDAYHKNRTESQRQLSMLLETYPFGFVTPKASGTNPDGANYEMELTNVNVVGNQLDCDLTFTPNQAFTDFMEAQDPNDRNMLLWIKVNDVNILVCDVEAQIVYPEFETLTLDQQDFVDHSQNTQVVSGNSITYSANTEDDLGFGCYFTLQRLFEYNFITAQIVAYNSSTNEEFVLQGITYNLAGLNFDPNGRLLLPATQVVNPQLPSTSEKVESILEYHTPLDTIKTYGVYLYYPFLNNWRYWLSQPNASVDFFPNDQTRNWVPYDSTGLWGVFVRIGVTNLNFEAFKRIPIEIKDYDSEPNIEQTIKLYREATGQEVNVLVENETNRVVCDHKLIASGYWDQTSVWGMITIEPTESNPRYLLSSVIDRVNNANPLSPLSGTKITITFPTPDVARLECFVNPNLVNLDNGIKFTSKIKGCADNVESLKITTGDVLKSTTDDLFKQKA